MATTKFDAAKIQRQLQKAINEKLKDKTLLKKITEKDLKEIGELHIDEILKAVSKGKSPIKGNNRFPAYKNPERYPDGVKKQFPSKKRRPVNLFLSGDFLSNLDFKTKKGSNPQITIGFFDRESILKEKGHRDGANGQPKRPIIPNSNEKFSPIIIRAIFKKMVHILDKAFKRR